MSASEFDIQLGFEDPPDDRVTAPFLVRGGIRVTADGTVLTRLETDDEKNETTNKHRYGSDGNRLDVPYHDFKGELASSLVVRLLNRTLSVADSDHYFREQVVNLGGESYVGAALVISYLDDQHVRLGYLNTRGRSGPTLDAALGRVVERQQLYDEALRATEAYLEYAENCAFSPEEVSKDVNIPRLAEELRDRIDH